METMLLSCGANIIFTHGGMSDVQFGIRTLHDNCVIPMTLNESKEFIKKMQIIIDKTSKSIQNENNLMGDTNEDFVESCGGNCNCKGACK